MNQTKKLPHTMTKDGKATSRGEYLIPDISNLCEEFFIGVKTGKRYKQGYVCYLGNPVTVDELIEDVGLQDTAAEEIIQLYFEQLSKFKIGNVLEISYSDADGLGLKLIAKRTKTDKPVRFP